MATNIDSNKIDKSNNLKDVSNQINKVISIQNNDIYEITNCIYYDVKNGLYYDTVINFFLNIYFIY